MKKNILTLLLACLSIIVFGCGIEGSGNVTTELRSLSVFSGIDLRNTANVYVSQGDVQEVKIEAEDNIVSLILTEVKNDELIIYCKENIRTKRAVNIYITVKSLCLLELSGSGSIITRSQFACDHMNIRLSGSGDVKVNLAAKSLKATLAGSGNMDLSGSAAEADMRISGSGNVNAELMKSFTSAISISGSGSGKVDVANVLTVNISGSGNVQYLSEPGHIQSRITGSGAIQKI